jgi:isoleucyl-tRNA synthetase
MTAASPFSKLNAQADFPELERGILELWKRLDAFEESNRRRAGAEAYVFYDGPPFATGTPHYGHLLAGTIKDIIPRYWNMRGHPVDRRFGWDCHGLPIEALAQEALGLVGTPQILEVGVDVFNEQCRSMVSTYVAEWEKTVARMGRWVDFQNDYKTMDTDYMESVWWVFKRLWEQGRVYRSHRIMPYSYKLTTPLSNFEANANYKDVQDPAITVRFRMLGEHPFKSFGECYLLAWTTTPWTLPSNLALCAGPQIDYVAVKDAADKAIYVLAEARLGAYYKKPEDYQVLARASGEQLKAVSYEPLFPYFKDHPQSFRVLVDDFVSTEDGTGLVHMAPAYGEDDFRICRDAGIELVDPLDAEAKFTEPVSEFVGQNCKDADKGLIRWLKDHRKLVQQSTIVHSYPFDERTDSPLIYRAIDAWYVKVADLRDKLVAANDAISWVPEAVGRGRFGNWLKDANDWNISRNRFWGSCIPLWINEADAEDVICIGSIDELEALSGERVSDLHKHVLDDVVIRRNGKVYRRTPEVLDCWFESGSMPYAQQHYPFERSDELESFFPAHFIAEGLDQTRGWFYTLLVLGVSLFGQAPYRNVVVNGMILAEDGQKMSKRKKNYPDPNQILEKYGADALRAYMIDSPVVRGEPLRFSEKGLKEIVRTVVLPFWNGLCFFNTYAVVDGFDPRTANAPRVSERPDIDRWLLSVLQSLVHDVNTEMEGYRLYTVVPRLVSFIDDLTNWYIRRSRPRFWKSEDDTDKACAYATLYSVLVTFSKVLAPFMPFLTENVYQHLVREVDAQAPESVHFCDYPKPDNSLIDEDLEARMQAVRRVVVLGRKLREDHRLKVRQPLAKLTVAHRNAAVRDRIGRSFELIEDELNVKEVAVEADESAFASVTVKPNFKTLGKRCGPKLKEIAETLGRWGFDEVSQLEAGKTIVVADEPLMLGDVLLHRKAAKDTAVATDGDITVVLDTRVTDALEAEGLAREFISVIQNARKEAGLQVTDRVKLTFDTPDPTLASALTQHAESIQRETLAVQLEQQPGGLSAKLNGIEFSYTIEKASQ